MEIRPGFVTADGAMAITDAIATVEALKNLYTSPGLRFIPDPSGFALLLDDNPPFPAVITSTGLDSNGVAIYGWEEQQYEQGGTYSDKVNGRQGVVIQTNATTSSDIHLTGIADTSSMFVGMQVIGSGIPAGTFIAAIISSTAVDMSASASASATVLLTFAYRPAYEQNHGSGIASGTFVEMHEGYLNITDGPDLEYWFLLPGTPTVTITIVTGVCPIIAT